MVDRLTIETDAGEGDWLVAEIVGETANHLRVRALGKRYVGKPVHVIEDETTSTFQTAALLLEIGVVDHIGNSIRFTQFIDDILPAFAPAEGGIHWKKRNSSIRM